MTDEQRAELKRLAEAATKGPWEHQTKSFGEPVEFVFAGPDKAVAQMMCGGCENALFIAAANPVAVLDLLAESERLKAVSTLLDDLAAEIERTTQWREAKGMKPATDTSEFCSAAPSVLINLKRWVRRFREAMEKTT